RALAGGLRRVGQRPRSALGTPGRGRRTARLRAARAGRRRQRRKLYRLLPRRAGDDPGTALRRAADDRPRRTGRSAAARARRTDGGVDALPAPAPALAAADRLRRLVPGVDRAAPGAADDRRLGAALACGLSAGRRALRLGIAAERVERLCALVQPLRLGQLPWPLALRGLRAPRVAGGR